MWSVDGSSELQPRLRALVLYRLVLLFMPATSKHMKLPLGGPAWLRAMADEKEEMADALPSETPDGRREDGREILGLRDAAERMTELEELVRSACAIADREGANTAWDRYKASAAKLHLNGITARVYQVLPDDDEENTEIRNAPPSGA